MDLRLRDEAVAAIGDGVRASIGLHHGVRHQREVRCGFRPEQRGAAGAAAGIAERLRATIGLDHRVGRERARCVVEIGDLRARRRIVAVAVGGAAIGMGAGDRGQVALGVVDEMLVRVVLAGDAGLVDVLGAVGVNPRHRRQGSVGRDHDRLREGGLAQVARGILRPGGQNMRARRERGKVSEAVDPRHRVRRGRRKRLRAVVERHRGAGLRRAGGQRVRHGLADRARQFEERRGRSHGVEDDRHRLAGAGIAVAVRVLRRQRMLAFAGEGDLGAPAAIGLDRRGADHLSAVEDRDGGPGIGGADGAGEGLGGLVRRAAGGRHGHDRKNGCAGRARLVGPEIVDVERHVLEVGIDRPAAACGEVDHEHQIAVEGRGRRDRPVGPVVEIERHPLGRDLDAVGVPARGDDPGPRCRAGILLGFALERLPGPVPVMHHAGELRRDRRAVILHHVDFDDMVAVRGEPLRLDPPEGRPDAGSLGQPHPGFVIAVGVSVLRRLAGAVREGVGDQTALQLAAGIAGHVDA